MQNKSGLKKDVALGGRITLEEPENQKDKVE